MEPQSYQFSAPDQELAILLCMALIWSSDLNNMCRQQDYRIYNPFRPQQLPTLDQKSRKSTNTYPSLLFPDGSKQECIKENDLCHVYGEYIVDNEFTIFPNGNQPDPFEGPGYQLTPVTPDPSPPQEYRPTIDEAKAAGINVGSGANQKRDASALPDDKESDHDTFAESFQDWEVMSTLVGWLNV